MTAKAAICKALLRGQTLSIKNGFTLFGVTNIPREIGRQVERDFGVKCDREPQTGVSRYGFPQHWFHYNLKAKPENVEGIKKMVDYVLKIEGEPKTQDQAREQERIKKLLLL